MMHSFDENTYNEILKSYNESDFEFFDLKNDLYYQLFYAYNDIESQENKGQFGRIIAHYKRIYR